MMRICPICGRNYDEHPALSRKDCKRTNKNRCDKFAPVLIYQRIAAKIWFIRR